MQQIKSMHFQDLQKVLEPQKDEPYYNKIIENLMKQNKMLKQQLQIVINSKQTTSDIHAAQTTEEQSLNLQLGKSKKGRNSLAKLTETNSEGSARQINEELLRQNNRLKEQLDRNSYQYQQKLSELSDLVSNLKQRGNFQVTSSKTGFQKSTINKLIEMMQSILKMYEVERLAFISKIEQLLQLISSFQTKQNEYQKKFWKAQVELQIAREQIIMFKRFHKTK